MMNKTYGFRTLAVLALLAVSVVITAACEGNKSRYPTQPEARDFINPETTVVVADFSCDTSAGLTIIFVDASTGNVDTYFWDFGDKKTSREKDPIHTYKEAGDYVVVHTVTNAISTDTVAKVCTVTEPVEEEAAPEGEG